MMWIFFGYCIHASKGHDRFGCYQMRSSQTEKKTVTHRVAVVKAIF